MPSQNFINNRKHMAKHPSQGDFKKVLCICSGGLLRSPTAAWVLSNPPFSFNTRSAGIEDKYALVPVSDILIDWAEEIVCMDVKHYRLLTKKYSVDHKRVRCLNISDDYLYREKKLINLIKEGMNDEGTVLISQG